MPFASDPSIVFHQAIDEHLTVIDGLKDQVSLVQAVAHEMFRAVKSRHKVLWCGNGGSAADSQHLAAELIGRFRRERVALPSIALTTDTSILTALGNDYGYERIFQRQVEALCQPGDVLVGISTSGSSKNVFLALKTGRELGAFTVAFTGQGRGTIADMADITLCVPSNVTARIQEAHILCGHMICDWIEHCICEQRQELARRATVDRL
jgi:D-sedoheptulose 7-phosphate isomerase